MIKVDSAVRRESVYVAVWIVILSILMQAVFLVINEWDYTVLCGNILSAAAAFANFFLLGLTVQKAVKMDEKQAASAMKVSQSLRLLMLLVVAIIGAALECFNIWATLIPLFFVRIAIAFRPLLDKKTDKNDSENNE